MTGTTQTRFSASDGLTLAGEIGGPANGPTVLLMHGGGQTRHSWSGAMQRLIEKGYRAVSYDARGHGDSGWSPTGDYSLPALSADLQAVIATQPGPIALVGASMGGMTSFYTLGAVSPPVANALVMVDITLRPAAEGVEKIRQFMTAHTGGFATLEEAADAVAAYNPSRPRPSDPSGLRKNLRLRDDGRLHWHWDPALLRQAPSPEPPSYSDAMIAVAGGVTVPTLLVRGGQSDIVDDDGEAEMCRLVPQTEVFTVAGAGHMVAGDRNDAFNEGVFGFLDRHLPIR